MMLTEQALTPAVEAAAKGGYERWRTYRLRDLRPGATVPPAWDDLDPLQKLQAKQQVIQTITDAVLAIPEPRETIIVDLISRANAALIDLPLESRQAVLSWLTNEALGE